MPGDTYPSSPATTINDYGRQAVGVGQLRQILRGIVGQRRGTAVRGLDPRERVGVLRWVIVYWFLTPFILPDTFYSLTPFFLRLWAFMGTGRIRVCPPGAHERQLLLKELRPWVFPTHFSD